MEKILSSTAVATVLVFAFTALLLAGVRQTIDLAPGDEVYACACGPECDCGTLSRVANVCGCGRDLVKARVVKVDAEEATLVVNDREKVFRTSGRYTCECIENCGCGTISQKPGKCSCGRILLPLRKN